MSDPAMVALELVGDDDVGACEDGACVLPTPSSGEGFAVSDGQPS